MNLSDTILIVDDAVDALQTLAKLLNPEYTVVLAKSGAQALERLQECQPVLVLLDVLLPDTHGFDLLKVIKAMPAMADVPVLMITQLDQPEDEVHALALGAADFISKPVNAVIVKARVRTQVRMAKRLRHSQQAALRDVLTSLPNRRHLEEVARAEFQRSRRNGRPLSVIMMDIDRFKTINDTWGHAKGDDVLRAVGRCLGECLSRAGDLVARYGGEEFVAILPDTDLDGAQRIAERIRHEALELKLPHPEATVHPFVTLSAGVATLVAGGPHGTIEELFMSADQALYAAKTQGRNRVMVSP